MRAVQIIESEQWDGPAVRLAIDTVGLPAPARILIDFGTRMTGTGLWADLIRQRFEKATRRLGFNRERIALDLSAFRPPGAAGQGSLF